MKRFISFLAAALLTITYCCRAADVYGTPDFAYPKTVSKDALRDLKKAMKTGNGMLTVNSLVRYGLAVNAIAADSLGEVIVKVNDVIAQEKSPEIKALLNLLLADIYYGIYSADRWKYDARQLPLSPLPDNYREWSGEQFRGVITDLLKAAVSDRETLAASPLEKWKPIIESDDLTFIFYPTLYDMMASQAIKIFNGIMNATAILPASRLAADRIGTPLPASITDPCVIETFNLYNSLIAMHADRPAPLILAEKGRIQLTSRLIYQSDSDQLSKAYIGLYKSHADSEYSAEALIDVPIDRNNYNQQARTDYYKLLTAYESRFPDYFNINAVKNRIAEITDQSVTVKCPVSLPCMKEFPVKISMRNTDSVTVYFFQVDNATDGYKFIDFTPEFVKNPAKVLNIKIPRQELPFRADTTVFVTLNRYGNYIIVPSLDSSLLKKTERQGYQIYTCSDLSLFITSVPSGTLAWTTDYTTGAPLPGTEINVSMDSTIYVHTETETNGSATITLPLKDAKGHNLYSPTVNAARGDDRYTQVDYFRHFLGGESSHKDAQIYTALPLYHPGDTVEWAAIVTNNSDNDCRILTDTDVTAILRDANGQEVGKSEHRTDATGRICGSFPIPTDGLTGNYLITLSSEKRYLSMHTFTVSDYKLPTFEIKFDDIVRADGGVTVSGRLVTFSGFPLADCTVDAELKSSAGFFRYSPMTPAFYTTRLTTDADGCFKIGFSPDIIALSPVHASNFTVNVTATSQGGESQSGSISFSTGKPYSITVGALSSLNTDTDVKLPVRAVDPMGKDVNIDIRVTVSDSEGKEVAHFPASSPDIKHLKPALYNFTFAPADTTLADQVTVNDVALYRPLDKVCPVDAPLWVPVTSISAVSGKVAVDYGTSTSNVNILAIIYSDTHADYKWLKPECGMNRIEVDLPDSVADMMLTLINIINGNRTYSTVRIRNLDQYKTLKIETETFRDRLVPGEKEQWKFRISRNDGTPQTAAVLLDMCAKSIAQLVPVSFNFSLPAKNTPNIYFSYSDKFPITAFQRKPMLPTPFITVPEINLYDSEFGYPTNNKITVLGYGMTKSSSIRIRGLSSKSTDNLVVTQEESEMAVKETAVEEIIGYASGASFDVENDSGDAPDSRNYRPAEIPLAFFAPMLTTDDDGSLEYSFTVPDANTTWIFNAIAYNTDLLTAALSREITASKPVMVQPSLPRFMRYGDTTTLLASVMNATDSVLTVTTTVELITPDNGAVIASVTSCDTIPAMKKAMVPVDIKAPTGGAALIYRIYSTDGSHADGERSLIALLPASQPVIETESFYIPAEETTMTMDISKAGADDNVTLQVWEDPIWEIITALPGISDREAKTSPSIATTLYSALVAEGVLRSHPSIERELRRWLSSSDADTTLVSALSRNEELKSMVLNSTPWVREAMNDTERMTRLTLLFDRKIINETVENCITRLAKLQNADGGWCWTADYNKSSEWTTYSVMSILGELRQQGLLPDNSKIKTMIEHGVSYLDKKAVESFRLNPKGIYLGYTYLRSQFSDIMVPTSAKRVMSTTIQRLVSGWKELSIGGKAIAAIILNHNNYPTTARRVIDSLKEYSTTSTVNGMWWQNVTMSGFGIVNTPVTVTSMILAAFNDVTPSDRTSIDNIRRWLFRQKEGQIWGTSAGVSTVINSILASEPADRATQAVSVKIGGTEVQPDSPQTKGWLVTGVTDMLTEPETLRIDKGTVAPVWGSVITRRIADMDDIKAKPSDDIAVEKSLLVKRGNRWEKADSLHVGDRVKVMLTVTTSRDLQFVTVTDNRPACFEPTEQLPAPIFAEGIFFYRENRDSSTNMFVDVLPRGTYLLETEMYVTIPGQFASGVATVQSQIQPAVTAHSAGSRLLIDK